MSAMKPIIVFIMLFAPSLCDDPPKDFGTPEEFLKEMNEYRAKFAKEYRIPNMCKVIWSNEYQLLLTSRSTDDAQVIYSYRRFEISSYRNPGGLIDAEIGKYKNQSDLYENLHELARTALELINPVQTFIGCRSYWSSHWESWELECLMGPSDHVNFQYTDPGEAGSQCPPRFKGENGLCVPVDSSKYTFWGTEEGLLEDVNYMRRKYAKKLGIPNMHQLTWNESLVEVLKNLDLEKKFVGRNSYEYLFSSDSSWDGFGKNWRITDEIQSFSAVAVEIDDAIYTKMVLSRKQYISFEKIVVRGKEETKDAEEMIHPLQTSIGCMKKEQKGDPAKIILTACLLGNMGQWPSDWKLDVNSKKVPGSECMNGYVNDDGLCVVAPPTTTPGPTTPTTPEATTTPKTTEKTTPKEAETVPATPMKPEASDEKEKEGASVEENASLEPGQEALESAATTRIYSYGPWIFMIICLLF